MLYSKLVDKRGRPGAVIAIHCGADRVRFTSENTKYFAGRVNMRLTQIMATVCTSDLERYKRDDCRQLEELAELLCPVPLLAFCGASKRLEVYKAWS